MDEKKSLSGALRFTGKANTNYHCSSSAAVWNGFRDRKKFIMVPLKIYGAFSWRGCCIALLFYNMLVIRAVPGAGRQDP